MNKQVVRWNQRNVFGDIMQEPFRLQTWTSNRPNQHLNEIAYEKYYERQNKFKNGVLKKQSSVISAHSFHSISFFKIFV